MAVGRAHAKILGDAAAPLLDDAVQRCAEAIAVKRMHHFEPVRCRAVERSALEAEHGFGFRAGENAIGGYVPIPYHVPGASQRQSTALDVRYDSLRKSASEGVLHHREADQHDDENEATEQRRPDDIVGQESQNRHCRADHPDHQKKPGRNQHHRAVETVGRKIDNQTESKHGYEEQRDARDAGGNRRREHGESDQRGQKREPPQRDMGIADVPAIQVEIREQEHQQCRNQDRFARGAPDALGARRHVEHFAPKTKINADVDQYRPAKRCGGRKHHAAFHHEQDREKQREQARDADNDALIKGERIDLVLESVRLPQVKLRQIRRAQFGDESDHRAGIERDAKDVGGGVIEPFRWIARRRSDVDDPREAKVRPDQA